MGEAPGERRSLASPSGVGLAALLLFAGLASARAQVSPAAPAQAVSQPVIYDDKLVEEPGPDANYDPDQGQPQALLPEPRDVVLPWLSLPWQDERQTFRQQLYDKYGITYGASYQQLSQYATQTLPGVGPNVAVGAWAATSITWTPLDRGGDYEGTLVFRGAWRGPLGDNPWPAPFGPAFLGLAWSNYEFTSWQANYRIEELFWEQRLGPEFTLRVGNQAPQAILNTFRFKDARTSFTASPVAFSESIPYPAFGAGVSFRWRPSALPGIFVNGAVNSMNGNPGFGSLNWMNLDWDQLFVGVEIGKQWRRENGEYDQLAIDIFHAGTRSTFSPNTTPNRAGGGFKILGEKQWGSIVGFAAYTYNTAQGGGISTTFSQNTAVAGVAYVRPFGIRGEMAIAGMWTQPFDNILPGSGQRDQWGTDCYWNIATTPNSTLTPDLQLIWNPSFNPKVNFVAIPAIKFRVAL
jgi:porin